METITSTPTLAAELAFMREHRSYLNSDGMRRLAVLTVVEHYEQAVRAERPDWADFLTEANAEPAEIAWEVVEHIHDVDEALPYALDGDDVDSAFVDDVFATAQRWLKEVTIAHDPALYIAPCPLCGGTHQHHHPEV